VTTGLGRNTAARLQTRLNHLSRLNKPAHGLTIEQANNAFVDAHGGGSKPLSVLVRRSFLARHKPKVFTVAGDHDKTPRKKPPLAASVRSRGVLLRTELTLLFLAQCRVRPTARISTPIQSQVAGEPGLIDYFSTGTNPHDDTEYRLSRPTMRTRQLEKALDTLAGPDLQLIEVGRRASGRLDPTAPMWLNQESGPQRTGDAHRYRTPSASETVISIPIEFFTKGWIQVMTDAEIANWLMWRDQGDMRDASTSTATDLFLDAQRRLDHYDLTRDTWDTHAMLSRLGLMTVQVGEVDATQMVGGKTKFRSAPHRFGVDDAPLQQDGHAAMLAAVAAFADE
jgi:hypothetical protein